MLSHHAAQMDVRRSVADPAVRRRGQHPRHDQPARGGARRSGVEKVLFVSSGGAVYGEQETFPAPETHPHDPVEPYGVSKARASSTASSTRPSTACRTSRSATPTSTGRARTRTARPAWSPSSASACCAASRSPINGDGKQTRDYVFVGDVARANLLALERDARRAGQHRHRRRDRRRTSSARTCSRADGQPHPRSQHGPAKAGRAAPQRGRHPPRGRGPRLAPRGVAARRPRAHGRVLPRSGSGLPSRDPARARAGP